MSRTRSNGRTAIVARRAPAPPVETGEIRALATAAGYEVVGELTQAGPGDPGSHFGPGKVDDLAALAASTGASVVVVDGELTPSQHHALQESMPDGVAVSDRLRLVLEIFEEQASTRRSQLQVELAQLRYDLPRLIESADEGLLNKRTEKGSPVYDVRDRIDRLERKLAELPDPAERFRKRRREEGFDLVTIAGYTNAGKSTLLHRIADDLSIEAVESDDGASSSASDDVSRKNATAAVEDRLFKTLETTTRRATIDDRPVLATDTVGFVDDLPHDLVASFSSTLSEAAAADAVVLVADASDSAERFRERLEVSLSVLDEQGVERDRIVTVCNKIDLLAADELPNRLEIAAELVSEPIPVSVVDGTNVDALRAAIADRLPTERETLELPNCDEAMSLVSRAYDRTSVESVDYDGSIVRVACRGRPAVIERLLADAESIESES